MNDGSSLNMVINMNMDSLFCLPLKLWHQVITWIVIKTKLGCIQKHFAQYRIISPYKKNKTVQRVILSSCRLDTVPVGFPYKRQWSRTPSWSAGTSWARRSASSAWKDREDTQMRRSGAMTSWSSHHGRTLYNWNQLNMTGKWNIYSPQAVGAEVVTEALVTASAERVPRFVAHVFIRADTCGKKASSLRSYLGVESMHYSAGSYIKTSDFRKR